MLGLSKHYTEGNMAERLSTGVGIIGAGIGGLWTAKELVDQGHDVTVVEQSATIADGQTTRNEGWLHYGTYHAAATEAPGEAARVAANTQYGHRRILEFA